MINYARSKKQKITVKNAVFVHADANRTLHDAPFDKIMAFSLLHLVSDVPEVLGAINDQLKPGGLFNSKTVCLNERHLAIKLMIRILRALRLAPDIKLLSQVELLDQIERAGFEIVETRYFGNQASDPYVVARRRGETVSIGRWFAPRHL